MSITDELREYAEKAVKRSDYMGGLTFDLRRIADRIDAALEGYIELPKDADGQIIHVGDMLDGYGRTIRVKELRNAGTWHLVDELGNEWHDHEAFVHVQPDSWERIIEDAQDDGVRHHEGKPSDFFALVERCKRLAGGGA